MSLSHFQSGTAAVSAARNDIAAEVREWIYQDDEEKKRQALEKNESRRQAAAQRAMREALAEQLETIQKNEERILAQRTALASLEDEQATLEAELAKAIANKDEALQNRLRAQALETGLSLAQKRFEAEAAHAEAATRREQLLQMEEEAKAAKADEAARQRYIKSHNAQVQKQKEQLEIIARNKSRADAQRAALSENEKRFAEAEKEMLAVSAKDEAAQKRLREQKAILRQEIAHKKEELELIFIEAESRRLEIVQRAKERKLQEAEEAERRREAAARRMRYSLKQNNRS